MPIVRSESFQPRERFSSRGCGRVCRGTADARKTRATGAVRSPRSATVPGKTSPIRGRELLQSIPGFIAGYDLREETTGRLMSVCRPPSGCRFGHREVRRLNRTVVERCRLEAVAVAEPPRLTLLLLARFAVVSVHWSAPHQAEQPQDGPTNPTEGPDGVPARR
jgi:hypothetical protein